MSSKILLNKGEVVAGRFRVTSGKTLGEGSFSLVFPAVDSLTNHEVALKIAKEHNSNALNTELKAIESLQGGQHVCKLEGSGSHRCADGFDRLFIAMQRVGKSISDLRREREGQRFTWPTARAVGLHMLKALEYVHNKGFLHRDVKPANFTIGGNGGPLSKLFFIIDFGLARKFQEESGQHCKQRVNAEFRGSSKYASVHALREEDQSRRDDLWSVLYVLVDLVEGELPWTKDCGQRRDDKEFLAKRKEECIQNPALLGGPTLPPQIAALSHYLKSLNFEDVPDYERMRNILLDGNHANLSDLTYDWEATRPTQASMANGDIKQMGGAAKRVRIDTVSPQTLAETVASLAHASGNDRLSHAAVDALRKTIALPAHEVTAMLAIIFRLLESHPDAGRLQPMFDDIAHMTAALRDRVGHKQAQAHPHYGHR